MKLERMKCSAGGNGGDQEFRYCSENFAILAKFRYIAKITVHSEIQIFTMLKFRYIAKVTVHRENSNFRYA